MHMDIILSFGRARGVTCIITLSLFLIQLLYHITTVVIMKSKEVEVLKEEWLEYGV